MSLSLKSLKASSRSSFLFFGVVACSATASIAHASTDITCDYQSRPIHQLLSHDISSRNVPAHAISGNEAKGSPAAAPSSPASNQMTNAVNAAGASEN